MPRPVIMSDAVHIREIFSSIQGEGYLAGRRQIFIRLTECNLDCNYCDTDFKPAAMVQVETEPGSAQFDHLPSPLSLQQLLAIISGWSAALPGAHHSLSITGGEPLLSADILSEWLPQLRALLPIHLETNGTLPVALAQVIAHLDYISMDMKLPSTAGCSAPLWDLHRLFLLAAQASNVSVKIVAGDRTTSEEINQVCAIIAQVDPAIPLFLQPLMLPGGAIGINAGHLLRLQAAAASRLPDVRVIPQMHKLLGAL